MKRYNSFERSSLVIQKRDAHALNQSSSIGLVVLVASAVIGATYFWVSYWNWATFQYHTFDLAFYVQALWNLCQGNFDVSLLNVPLLGNHADVIVLLMVPLFALFSHPLLPVFLQITALAWMPVIGFRYCRRLGFNPEVSALLSLGILIAPATGFVALHEFHPEAFTALFLLLMIEAFQRNSLSQFWVWFLATLICKENMALLLSAYCIVHACLECHRGKDWVIRWCLWPLLTAVCWIALYVGLLAPRWNAGNVEFLELYSGLGNSVPDILWNLIIEPGRVFNALAQGLKGNLLWALLLPFCGFPLIRPRWMIIALPVLLQHLLSFRSSEWSIYLHYSAPLIPLFWVAACEAISLMSSRIKITPLPLAALLFLACITAQLFIGPAKLIALTLPYYDRTNPEILRKKEVLTRIPSEASVMASMPYLSHLAMREKLFSLHHVLKGLKTLSSNIYHSPETVDFVLVDYEDSATFDASAGYYHPKMRTVHGLIIPSSDRLFHEFLRKSNWDVEAKNAITVFKKNNNRVHPQSEKAEDENFVAEICPGTRLITIQKNSGTDNLIRIETSWQFKGERMVFPWLALKFIDIDGTATWLNRGLCVPQGWDNGNQWNDIWVIDPNGRLPVGVYTLEAYFFDNTTLSFSRLGATVQPSKFTPQKRIELGILLIKE